MFRVVENKKKLGAKFWRRRAREVTEREVRREKGERNRKQKLRSLHKEEEELSSPPGTTAAPLSPPWPSATTIQHHHSATISAANANRTREWEKE